MQEEPILTDGAFDSPNLTFWDTVNEHYVCVYRDFSNGVRTIRTSTSTDFRNWTTGQWADFGDAPPEHLYTNATWPYFRAPHIYLAFPRRFLWIPSGTAGYSPSPRLMESTGSRCRRSPSSPTEPSTLRT